MSVCVRVCVRACVSVCVCPIQGVILSLLGPTLLDLSCNVNSSLQSVVYVFTSRSIGYVVGSIVSGVVFDRFDANLLLAIALPCTALGKLCVCVCVCVCDFRLLSVCLSAISCP